MSERYYYSVRTGKHPAGRRLSLNLLKELMKATYLDLDGKGYFQEYFGYDCVDAGYVLGKAGDIETYILKKVRKQSLWPIETKWNDYTEDDLFDVIEFLYDHISKPVDGWFHSYGECGWHYKDFDREPGRQEYRAEMNQLLRDYEEGYELSEKGEILSLPESGMQSLLEAQLPHHDPDNVESRVEYAKQKFRYHRASAADRREAVRTLADVLEFLRPKVKEVLIAKDEDDLFNIANNFGIRHHRQGQKTEYDQSIWLSWMFYFYLATIHAALHLVKKKEEGS